MTQLYLTAFEVNDVWQEYVRTVWAKSSGGTQHHADIKKVARVYQKLTRAYSLQVEKLTDICRSTITFGDLHGLAACLKLIHEDENMRVLKVKNRFDPAYEVDESGYRDVSLLITGAVTNDMIAELQLNVQSIFDCKSKGGHQRYVANRDARGD